MTITEGLKKKLPLTSNSSLLRSSLFFFCKNKALASSLKRCCKRSSSFGSFKVATKTFKTNLNNKYLMRGSYRLKKFGYFLVCVGDVVRGFWIYFKELVNFFFEHNFLVSYVAFVFQVLFESFFQIIHLMILERNRK